MIKQCKSRYKDKVEQCFARNDSKSAWTGLSYITGRIKKASTDNSSDAKQRAEDLNEFYCRFEKPDDDGSVLHPQTDNWHTVTEDDVRRTFQRLRINKAQGPDGLSPRLLKCCAQELTPIFTVLFNQSIEECNVPKLWKMSTVVPVPKKPSPAQLNDYRPVALTSYAMKSFERLVLRELLREVRTHLDVHQFAYKEKRGVEDGSALLIHAVTEHLEKSGSYARVLFVDFSSAFNAMRPSVLMQKLGDMNVQPSLRRWLLSYLRHRPQTEWTM